MKLHLLAVGTRPPAWVQAGYDEYARRLPRECALTLREFPLARRGKGEDAARSRTTEGERLLGAVPAGAVTVALDERGRGLTTRELADRLGAWRDDARDVAFLVGGPDGLDPSVRERADLVWSLSPLTLPHALVRVVVAEALYRAWTVNTGHPYHRD
ncbi:MAG: 23S rRNA (pseudouridine(1915)-N(3))-methyltransferase RlmH [Ectothiorhodospiraceae bacterium]|nr:23S rRNA (pseudouridine(1915)-N(3))-methyltransferase RlmH [Chromatiales bacterium]MCP5156317.1 23S rRNA (pseudouridine(1915)-N(3))-methyltransferase RlmH [Ectothiorhodospiraceae bacterium]